jgi:hypothetical protein
MAEDIVSTNQKVRELLRRSSPLMIKRAGEVSATSLGSTVRQKLLNVGLLTGLRVFVEADVSIATATVTPGPRGALAFIPRIRVSDFDGSDRVIASAWQLLNLARVRQNINLYAEVQATKQSPASTDYPAGALTMPQVPTATGTNQKVRFWLYVPIAVNVFAGDLRGMLLAQTGVGELYATYDIATAVQAASDLAPYTSGGGTVTFNSIRIVTYQEFFLPQQVEGAVPIPPLDTLTVYELNGGVTTTDNIAQGQEKLISLPNARSVLGLYYNYISANTFADMDQHRLIANGNTIIREYVSVDAKEIEQRWLLQYDLPDGNYFMDFSVAPIQTNLFGNIQLGLTPLTAPTTPKIEVLFESLYMKGAALSGLSQAG